jgi:hypothetical protein
MPMSEAEIEKAKSIIAALPPDDSKLLNSFIDNRTILAIKTFTKNHPPVEDVTKRLSDANRRLVKIDKAANDKIQALELRNYIIKKSYTLNISPDEVEALGMTFIDTKDADVKLELLSKSKINAVQNNVSELLANSYRPGTGAEGPQKMSKADYAAMPESLRIAMQENGSADRLID